MPGARAVLASAALALCAVTAVGAEPPAPAADRPSRAATKGCRWEKLADAKVGLAAWVERCDYGFRKIDFLFQGRSLAMRYSDGKEPDPVVDVFDLQPGETPEAGLRRVFDARTDPAVARRCVLKPYRIHGVKTPAGVRRFAFEANAELQKEVDAKTDPGDIPEPACGDWGDMPDGIQYFEVHPASRVRRVLFVRYGQDEPLFDEKTLKLIE